MTTKSSTSVQVITGNEAAALAGKMARVQMVCFFPIGPSDEVGENLAKMVRRGELDARVVDLENERSAVNAQLVGAQAGVRTIFATNSEGLVFAYQPLFWAPYARQPIVVCVAHRAMEPPTTITTDDHDTIIFRDSHWLQFYCENPQDVFDTTIQAYKIAERHDVLLPAFVTWAGWEVSHSSAPVEVPEQGLVDRYLPPLSLPEGQDFLTTDFREYYGDRPGGAGRGLGYMEHRYMVDRALNHTAKMAIREAHREYVETFGRGFGGLVESERCDDADVVIVTLGNITALAREIVNDLRGAGERIGMLKVRTLRPFPDEELKQLTGRAKVVLVLDRNCVYALSQEVRSVLYSLPAPPKVLGRVIALGGRPFTIKDMGELAVEALEVARTGVMTEEVDWRFKVVKD